jgi:hypothetical protein
VKGFINPDAKTKLCRCGDGFVMTGRHTVANAKSHDGAYICIECKMKEIYAAFKMV